MALLGSCYLTAKELLFGSVETENSLLFTAGNKGEHGEQQGVGRTRCQLEQGGGGNNP